MKTYLSIFLFCSFYWASSQAQQIDTLELTQAYELLENHYPILKNESLLAEILEKDLDQLDRERLPQITLNNQTQLQSQSTSLNSADGSVPIEIDQPLFSVRSYVEANYQVRDGGMNKARKKFRTAQHQADIQSLRVERYALKEGINHLFIQTTLLREQAKLLQFSKADIQARLELLNVGLEQGIRLQSEVQQLEVRVLELEQLEINNQSKIQGLIDQLSVLTNRKLTLNTILLFPALPEPRAVPALNRPELSYFQSQKEAILAQSDMLEAKRKPTLNLFAQAGGGYPNPLNLLDNGVAPYALIGSRFRWQISDWKKTKTDKQLLSLQALTIDHQEETFRFNLEVANSQYQSTIDRLQRQIEQDQKIADLQAKILKQLAVQLEEGVITSSDYIIQLNAELSAKQNLAIHRIELKKAQIEMLNQQGGL